MSRLYFVDTPGPGRLAIMRRPDGGERLAETMAALRMAGVDTLVNALTHDEQVELELTGEGALAEAAGLSYVAFPVPDRTAAEAYPLWRLAERLAGEIRQGRCVVAHCWAGIGRSGTIAGATLIALGTPARSAIRLLSQSRGCPSPETQEQIDLLVSLDARAETVTPPL